MPAEELPSDSHLQLRHTLPIHEAQNLGLCRFCGEPAKPSPGDPIELNFGKEYAHRHCIPKPHPTEMVNHPDHYGGKENPYEVIKVLKAWGLVEDAYLWNVVKYVARARKKGKELEDLRKARFYLEAAINEREDA